MTGTGKTRVAVIGARGIGRHHAHWWMREGAEVCAIVGTSQDSLDAANDSLRELFDFEGRGYTNLAEMLECESPSIVDVCSPTPLHFEHARVALEAGCDVLCEKPFVYDPALSRKELLAQGGELASIAQAKRLRLGVCTQYVMGARLLAKYWRENHPGEAINRFLGHLASPAKGREPDPVRVWVDLAPHLLSVLQAVEPDAQVDWDSARTDFDGYAAKALFDLHCPRNSTISCELYTNNTLGQPANVRHVAFNGNEFSVESGKDEDGLYCSRIESPSGSRLAPDFMRLLIREFLAGEPVADARFGITNLDLLLRFKDIASQ